jgi:hypothetical protein
MAKLKNIIKQLSNHDYEAIYHSLVESNADKSAYLLKSMREKSQSDTKIMEELGVNTNAYYTLRSRLYQKIEEYLLTQMESPRTDLLKRVANINETIFTKKPAITIATLKRLEKELIEYDLSNELTVVYKNLKKLHINSPDYFTYSQNYNKHVAYMLAVDKAEDMLSEYFKKFGVFSLTGDEIDKLGLKLFNDEMTNVCKMYESHRLYVFQSCINVFHRLFVEEDKPDDDAEPIEDILDKVEKFFKDFELDIIYHHLELVFEYLRLEYYNHYKVYKKAEKYYEDVNESTALLLSNYALYTYPAQFLMTKIERNLRLGTEGSLYDENEVLFDDFEYDKENVPQYINYVVYRALACHYAGRHDEAARWLNNLLNELSLKRYQFATIEIKSILALQYCLMQDAELFNQLVNSIQRQIRLLGKEDCSHIISFLKILKIAMSDVKRDKIMKIKAISSRITDSSRKHFSPTQYVIFDDKLVNALCPDAVQKSVA